jgi:Rrf2 family protein
MRFSLQVHYAVRGVFDLAYNGLGQPVQVRVIGDRQEIPPRYLEQIFQRLRRADIVKGRRGPGGGYVLARDARSITLRDVIEAVEGPVGGELAAEPEGATSSAAAAGRPDFVWEVLASQFAAVLEGVSLADLCRQAAHRGVQRLSADPPDYQI